MSRTERPVATRRSRRAMLGALGALGAAPVVAGGLLMYPGTAAAEEDPAQGAPRAVPRDLLPRGRFDRFVAEQAAADAFSGNILVGYQGRPVLQRSHGMANRERGIPNHRDTAFQLHSMGKIFGAIAIGQLAAQGRVDFHDPVGRHLDGFRPEVAEQLTVHRMFTFTGGLEDFQRDPDYQAAFQQFQTFEDYFDTSMEFVRRAPVRYQPGTRYSYSNSDIFSIGAIVAELSGQTWWDYVREHIFAPAGMTRSDFFTMDEWRADDRIARLYMELEPGGERVDFVEVFPGNVPPTGPGAGGFCTARDLLQLVRALWDGTLLPPAYLELISSGKLPIPPEDRSSTQPPGMGFAAYGMDQYIVNGHRVQRRNGTFPNGGQNQITVYPDLDLVVIILGNYGYDILPYLALQDEIVTGQS